MKRLITTMKQWAAISVALLGMLAILPAQPAQAALTCEVSPSRIPITMTYHGAKLTITGQSGANDDLVLKISSPPTHTAMKYYGKAAGLLWMKMGSLEFKGVPAVYTVNTTADLDRILPEAARNEHQLGYAALGNTVTIEDSKGEAAEHKWFDEFIRFKEHEMVYSIQQGSITRQHGEKGNSFQIVIDWPYQAPPATYNVELLAVNNGVVVDKAATTFEVQREGLAAALSKMAVEQAALYGIMAVLIALAAGSAVGAIFKSGGSH